MPLDEWLHGLIVGLALGVPIGLALAYVVFPWLARQWENMQVRRLLGRRHA